MEQGRRDDVIEHSATSGSRRARAPHPPRRTSPGSRPPPRSHRTTVDATVDRADDEPMTPETPFDESAQFVYSETTTETYTQEYEDCTLV